MELFVKARESKKPKLHISPLSVFIYAFHLVNNHFLSDLCFTEDEVLGIQRYLFTDLRGRKCSCRNKCMRMKLF